MDESIVALEYMINCDRRVWTYVEEDRSDVLPAKLVLKSYIMNKISISLLYTSHKISFIIIIFSHAHDIAQEGGFSEHPFSSPLYLGYSKVHQDLC
jgi:hypothetical protein